MDAQGVEVERLRAKDAQAFRSLIERLQQPLTRYLYRLVKDHEVALDLAQDTFFQVYKEIHKMPPDLALDAWIYRIATNYAFRHLNRKRLRQIVHLSFPLGNPREDSCCSHHTDTEDILLYQPSHGSSMEELTEIRLLIAQAFTVLKPQDALCLLLHFGNGFTYEQIGKIVAITPEAVRKRVTRGVTRFRIAYGQALLETPSYEKKIPDYRR